MVRVTDTPRGGRRSVEVAAARLADTPVPASDVVATPPAGFVPVDNAVLPDPTLKAEPGVPQPIVTAAPPLAAEPDALDVAKVEADAAAPADVRTAAAGGGDSVAGQSMLAIERDPKLGLTGEPHVAFGDRASLADMAPRGGWQGQKIAVIEVVGPPQGRRRAGLAFGPEPRRFLATQLTGGQLSAIRADPMLAVGVTDVDRDALADIAAFGDLDD